MSLSVKICWIIVIILLYMDVLLFCFLLIRRTKKNNQGMTKKVKLIKLRNTIFSSEGEKKSRVDETEYYKLRQSIKLEELKKQQIENQIINIKKQKKYIRRLKSRSTYRRAESSVKLGDFATEEAKKALEKTILKEKKYPVKLYMANALADIGSLTSIPVLIDSLIDAHRWYRNKVNMLIADFGEDFLQFLPQIYDNHRVEIVELIVDVTTICYSDQLKNYLVWLIDHKEQEMKRLDALYGSPITHSCSNCKFYIDSEEDVDRVCKYKGKVKDDYWCKKYKVLPVSVYAVINYNKALQRALEVLVNTYPFLLGAPQYLYAKDTMIKNAAIRALVNHNGFSHLDMLYEFLDEEEVSKSVIYAMTKIIDDYPNKIGVIGGFFEKERDLQKKQQLARVLSGKIEYFIMSLLKTKSQTEKNIIKQILMLGVTSETIDFLNKNKNIELENELVSILKEVIPESETVKKDISIYLEDRLCVKCGLQPQIYSLEKREEKKDRSMIAILLCILCAILLITPIIYCFRHYDILLTTSLVEQLKIFVVDFNYYLAYYSIAINSIYLLLLGMSYYQVNVQSKRWNMKPETMLFKNRMLPSISILAPAFNEELTIIENANSLLNLEYPDYELIIVNDGSSDSTLDTLIRYFDLKRVDVEFKNRLETKPVRGVYLNTSIPKLIVIDKTNGGKADSLNSGINYSKKEYFCGIDADSILERDALLKLSSLTLDQGMETPALGGNVYPINGCTVEKGYLQEKHIPKKSIARFQNIEYIRAFMAGRLGWASMNSLLIISGAFGLFRKERIIEIGGYLTKSGKYAKDTVGEDMELVVRIRRLMKELNLPFKICYAFNANCWTEVPEDITSLRQQRYRWHRGLIEILVFHRKMLFNPCYGRTGVIAIPYFFLFEMIGPILELEGYIMVIAAIILGLINEQIALLLFISSVLLGTLVSLSSLVIAEKDVEHFKMHEIVILIFYAFIENWGPRQVISIWRVRGYFKMFRRNNGWGKPKRKGFSTRNK